MEGKKRMKIEERYNKEARTLIKKLDGAKNINGK